MHIGISIQGVEELARQFDELNEKIREETLVAAVTAAGTLLVEEAQANAPVSATAHTPKGHKPGTLKARGIGMGVFRRTRGPDSVTAGVGFTKKGWYGVFAELGTVDETPRPFIVPAYERLKPAIAEAIGSVISRAVKSWDDGRRAKAFR